MNATKSFKNRLKTKLESKLGSLIQNLKVVEEIPNIISIYADKSKFVLDIIDGMFVSPDNYITDEFDYYVGDEVIDTDGSKKIEFQSNNPSCNWRMIRTVENMIDFIYRNEILNTLVAYSYKKDTTIDKDHMLTKEAVAIIKKAYEEKLTGIMRLNTNTEDTMEYNVHAYLNYMDKQSVVLYTQIGYPTADYNLDRDNRSFFLVIDPARFTCGYGTDFPWVSPTTNLFSMVPDDVDEPRDFKSALQITVDEVFDVIRQTKEGGTYFYTKNPSESGLQTDEKKVTAFIQYLKDDIKRNYPAINPVEEDWMTWDNKSDGITRINFGCVVLDVAVDSCGTIDIAIDHEICAEETWDDILYKKREISIASDDTLKDLNLLTYTDCDNIESRTIMEDIGNIVMIIMGQKMEGSE